MSTLSFTKTIICFVAYVASVIVSVAAVWQGDYQRATYYLILAGGLYYLTIKGERP